MSQHGLSPPTAGEIRAAAGCSIPNLIAPGLRVFFCGINPGSIQPQSSTILHGPVNRFWPALHLAGLGSTGDKFRSPDFQGGSCSAIRQACDSVAEFEKEGSITGCDYHWRKDRAAANWVEWCSLMAASQPQRRCSRVVHKA
jgi:hypothetical protein